MTRHVTYETAHSPLVNPAPTEQKGTTGDDTGAARFQNRQYGRVQGRLTLAGNPFHGYIQTAPVPRRSRRAARANPSRRRSASLRAGGAGAEHLLRSPQAAVRDRDVRRALPSLG